MGNVPVVTEDASADFVTQALRSTGGIEADTLVAEVEHDRIGEGVGLMCNLARLTLRYKGPAHNAPSSVILKVPSNLPENRGVGDHFNFYEREGRFYAEVSESLPVRTPHCYYNHIDVDANEFALLIEDFGGRTMVSQVAGIDFERAAEAVKALALVHAEWWQSPKLETLTWMPRTIDPVMLSGGSEYRRVWDHFVDVFADRLPEGSVALGERIGPIVGGDADRPVRGRSDHALPRRLPCGQPDVRRRFDRPGARGDSRLADCVSDGRGHRHLLPHHPVDDR